MANLLAMAYVVPYLHFARCSCRRSVHQYGVVNESVMTRACKSSCLKRVALFAGSNQGAA
jgi:hypothetical protein